MKNLAYNKFVEFGGCNLVLLLIFDATPFSLLLYLCGEQLSVDNVFVRSFGRLGIEQKSDSHPFIPCESTTSFGHIRNQETGYVTRDKLCSKISLLISENFKNIFTLKMLSTTDLYNYCRTVLT